ncbi:MAG: restriction endonuclease [Actinomycetota bacterium]|nr:restriction endonuclease [Actinomycetota bacterium]
MSTRVTLRHADWLSLVDATGPFLTLPVLRRVWPSGLDRTPPGRCAEVREMVAGLGRDDVSRRRFVEWVLRRLLAFGPTLREGQGVPETLVVPLAEHGVVLRPDFAVVEAQTSRTRLLVSLWPAGTDFAAHVAGERWAASPVDRMATHLRSTGVQLGLVTDGDRFCLVWAPRTGPVGRATWVASVFTEAAERTLLDSFTSVLGARRFFAVVAEDQLEALLAESASAQAEVTSQLGLQVRRAVELLVASFSRANRDHGGTLLAGLNPNHVYEAACTVMMRLVFLLSAEERRLLPLGDELYDRSYAVSTLRQELRQAADDNGDETLEHSYSAWPRLLATFRAVHGGLSHDQLRLPAYGGRLFDPDRYPFLEGREPGQSWRDTAAAPLPVDDRTMLAILTAVQILEMREGGATEARRLSFRSLDVEQIGHVYEGLLDHGAQYVDTVTLGLFGKAGEEPEASLAQLELYAEQGDGALVPWLAERTQRSEKQVRDALDTSLDDGLRSRLRAACDNDDGLLQRLQRYGRLLRDDVRGLPMVLLPGSVFVTEVSHRRDTGTEYTTKELADEVVRYALEPLVYSPGPAEGAPPEQWKLKSSADIEALRVCDPAVGSGAIITAACRYLADRLLEAWAAERATPLLVRADSSAEVDDVLIAARRTVAERCLYGVDRDPMAVEMAKLSLWLITMAKDRPFSFLDHAFRPGDSLLGVTDLDQVTHFAIDPNQAVRPLNFAGDLEPLVKEALELRRRIEEAPVVDTRHAEEKERLLEQAYRAMRTVNVLADLVVGAALSTAGAAKNDETVRLAAVSRQVREAFDADGSDRDEQLTALADQADAWLNEGRPTGAPLRRPLHWPLAFPEVFLASDQSGFDAIVGNPPYVGNKYWRARLGADYQRLFERLFARKLGKPDLVVVFLWRMTMIAREGGFVGSLATQSITEVDSRSLLESTVLDDAALYRAVSSRKWPGTAAVFVALVWLVKGGWEGTHVLNDQEVPEISASLGLTGAKAQLHRLAVTFVCFEGIHNGRGMALVVPDTHPLTSRYPDLFRPYVSGDDLASSDPRIHKRYVIDLTGYARSDLEILPEEVRTFLSEVVQPTRTPELLESYKGLARRWWTFWNTRESGFRVVRESPSCVVMPAVSKYIFALELPSQWAYTNKVMVFEKWREDLQTILLSTFFSGWVERYGGSLSTTLVMKISSVVETFPFPVNQAVAHGQVWQEAVLAAQQALGGGITRVLNAVHNSEDRSAEIERIRRIVSEVDISVQKAYGFSTAVPEHGFHETRLGARWTISPAISEEFLDLLVELNHERHAAEVAAAPPPAKGSGRGRRKQVARSAPGATVGENTLFGPGLFSGDDA